MSEVKYIGEERYPILVPVQGGVTVEYGDLMFLDNTVNLRNDGDSTATLYAYPIKYFRTSGASIDVNIETVKSYFLGVALDDKDGQTGATSLKLNVATEGVFEYPLKPGRSVYPGDYFCATGTTSASNMYNQYIKRTTDVNRALGLFFERKLSAQRAYVSIRSIFDPRKLS